jgi:hypothetical protein
MSSKLAQWQGTVLGLIASGVAAVSAGVIDAWGHFLIGER